MATSSKSIRDCVQATRPGQLSICFRFYVKLCCSSLFWGSRDTRGSRQSQPRPANPVLLSKCSSVEEKLKTNRETTVKEEGKRSYKHKRMIVDAKQKKKEVWTEIMGQKGMRQAASVVEVMERDWQREWKQMQYRLYCVYEIEFTAAICKGILKKVFKLNNAWRGSTFPSDRKHNLVQEPFVTQHSLRAKVGFASKHSSFLATLLCQTLIGEEN